MRPVAIYYYRTLFFTYPGEYEYGGCSFSVDEPPVAIYGCRVGKTSREEMLASMLSHTIYRTFLHDLPRLGWRNWCLVNYAFTSMDAEGVLWARLAYGMLAVRKSPKRLVCPAAPEQVRVVALYDSLGRPHGADVGLDELLLALEV